MSVLLEDFASKIISLYVAKETDNEIVNNIRISYIDFNIMLTVAKSVSDLSFFTYLHSNNILSSILSYYMTRHHSALWHAIVRKVPECAVIIITFEKCKCAAVDDCPIWYYMYNSTPPNKYEIVLPRYLHNSIIGQNIQKVFELRNTNDIILTEILEDASGSFTYIFTPREKPEIPLLQSIMNYIWGLPA